MGTTTQRPARFAAYCKGNTIARLRFWVAEADVHGMDLAAALADRRSPFFKHEDDAHAFAETMNAKRIGQWS